MAERDCEERLKSTAVMNAPSTIHIRVEGLEYRVYGLKPPKDLSGFTEGPQPLYRAISTWIYRGFSTLPKLGCHSVYYK